MAVEVRGSCRGQHHVPAIQRKVRGVRSANVVRDHRRYRAAIRVRAHRVIEKRLTRTEPAFSQSEVARRVNRDNRCVVDVGNRRGHRMRVGREFAESTIPDQAGDLNGLEYWRPTRDIRGRIKRDRRVRRTRGDRDGVFVVQIDGDRAQRRILTDVRRVDNTCTLRHRGRRAERDHRIIGRTKNRQCDRMRNRHALRAVRYGNVVLQRHRLI